MAPDHKKNDSSDTGQAGAATPAPGQAHEGRRGTVPDGGSTAGTAGLPGSSALPRKAAEDEPRGWGDREDDDHDAWLKEQKPPHWG